MTLWPDLKMSDNKSIISIYRFWRQTSDDRVWHHFRCQNSDVKPGVDGKTYILFSSIAQKGKKRGIINASVKLPSKTKKEEMERRKIIEKREVRAIWERKRRKEKQRQQTPLELRKSELKEGRDEIGSGKSGMKADKTSKEIRGHPKINEKGWLRKKTWKSGIYI